MEAVTKTQILNVQEILRSRVDEILIDEFYKIGEPGFYNEVAIQCGTDKEYVRDRARKLRKRKLIPELNGQPLYNQPTSSADEYTKFNADKGTMELGKISVSQPQSPEEVIKLHNIDTTKWKLSQFWSKQKSNGWLISALFSRIAQEEVAVNKFADFVSSYEAKEINIEPIRNKNFADPACAVISLCDFHLDKLEDPAIEVGVRMRQYEDVLNKLIYRAYHAHHLEEIVFVVGNDMYQTDTYFSQTTKGTFVDSAITWDKAYELGFELMVESITKLKSFCDNLHVILVQGNHAKTKEFYLAHALEVYFKNTAGIYFNRSSENQKIHIYGETLFCLDHGNNLNDKLPLTFATTFYKEWGQCRYKEILLGDKHHTSEKLIKAQGEAHGVRMRILPALTGSDRWHKDNLFVNAIQAGLCLVYDKKRGKISEYEERI